MPTMASSASTGQTPDIHENIEVDRNEFYKLAGIDVNRFREYAQGIQPRTLTDEAADLLEGVVTNKFCDNVCHKIIFEAANRLELLRWECPEDEAIEEFLNNFFITAKIKDFSAETHYNALRDGNYAVGLGWDNERMCVTLSREQWWNGIIGVYVAYDVSGNPLYAVKDWQTLDGIRRVVWFEDRMERYINQSGGVGGWEQHVLPEDAGEWPQVWTKDGTKTGDPLHIPIIHFPNVIRGASNYGTSELDGGVLGFQDQINDIHWDLTAAGRFTGFQQMWVSGWDIKRGPDGKILDESNLPQPGPGQIWISGNKDTKYGVIPAGEIEQLIKLMDEKKKSLSNMTSTPYHMISGGDWPSGEALLRAEKPAIDKAMRQTAKFSDLWVTVAHRAVEIYNAFGKGKLNEDALISCVFADPARRDPISMSTVVANLTGRTQVISVKEANRIMGRTPQQAEDIWNEIKDEKDDMGQFLLSSFDQGKGAGSNAPQTEDGKAKSGDMMNGIGMKPADNAGGTDETAGNGNTK